MDILKFDYLKTYETDLKQQLSVDKKYLPISKKLVVLLRDINPFLAEISDKHKKLNAEYLQKSININKTYAESIDNFQRSLKILIEKNHAEVEKSQKTKISQTHELNINFKSLLEQIEEKINQATQTSTDDLFKADVNSKRELAQIQKLMIEARKLYQETSTEIEDEKTDATNKLKEVYDQRMADLEEEIKRFEDDHALKISLIRTDTQKSTTENDDIYLDIKNNYSQLSIQFNKKINEIKKKHQQALTFIDKDNETRIKPILEAIENLKLSYQEAQKKALQNFSDRLTSLNVIFDVQKLAYESKKERIVHESNDAITLLNSKLSAFRETIQKEKLSISREMRDSMKSMEDEHEREKTNHQLTRALNNQDSELNKQIIRTNKDILNKQREMQQRIFNLDQQHLREINEWRLKKVLYEYEKKQEFAKIELNFHHNLSTSELQLKHQEAYYTYQKDLLLLNHNKDLLPLEFQLSIGASVQERELNLLGNDAHQAIAYFKHQEQMLEHELKKNQAYVQLERDKAKALFYADTQVLNISNQLELEMAKVKRDYALSEQELRIELNQALLKKSQTWIKNNLNQEVYVIESEREIIYIENKYALDLIKKEALAEQRKREFVVNEAKYKNQQRLSAEKASKLLKTYENELEFNQFQTEAFMDIMRMFHARNVSFRDAIIELYHLPSHPEVFKSVLTTLINLSKELLSSSIQMLEHFQSLDQEFYIKKIEDLTGYKYMLKHEDMMNLYEQEIAKINEKKEDIQKDIKALEEQFFSNQSELERNNLSINQLTKSGFEMKNNESKAETKHHDIKENLKQLSNHEHEIKRIKQNLARIEKSIDLKHASVSPLDLEIEKIVQKQKISESTLEKDKHQEASLFYKYLNQSQGVYQRYAMDLKIHFEEIIKFYDHLNHEVYVSDSFLDLELKSLSKNFLVFEKNTNTYQQTFLNLMLSFYHSNQQEQEILIKGFKKSTFSLIKSLNKNHETLLNNAHKDHKKREHDKNRQITVQKEKVKKKLELEKISYEKSVISDMSIIKVLETQIGENTDKQVQELKLLNENLQSSAQQYANEHEAKILALEEAYKKALAQIDTTMLNFTKNYLSLEEAINNKNQVILTKYATSREKSLMLFNQKTEHYESQMIKAIDTNTERNKIHEITLKSMNQKRESDLKNIQFHLKRFTSTTRSSQNRELNKEIRVLKKSYNFRVKMLHLS